MDEIKIEIVYNATHKDIGINIKIPYYQYASHLFPNEYLRTAVIAALDRVLDEAHNRR